MYALKAYRQLRKRGYNCRLLIAGTGPAGARDPPLHRDAPFDAASNCSAASATRTRSATSPLRTCTCHPPPARSRWASCCSRHSRRARPSCAATSTATAASCAVASRACSCRPRDVNALTDALGQLLSRSRDARADGRVGAPARRSVRLGQHHGQGRGVLPLRDPARRRTGPPAAAHQPGTRQPGRASRCRSTRPCQATAGLAVGQPGLATTHSFRPRADRVLHGAARASCAPRRSPRRTAPSPRWPGSPRSASRSDRGWAASRFTPNWKPQFQVGSSPRWICDSGVGTGRLAKFG